MFFIRQGATHKVVLGPAVAVGDGFTPVTTLALTTADEAEAILHDNGTVVSISGYTWAAITTADGYYHLTLQSGISGTVGHMTVVVNDDSLCLPLRADFTVLEEAAYDAMYAASAPGFATVAALATVDTEVGQIKAVTDVLPDSGALTTIGTDTARLTAARAQVLDDWINAGRLDLILDIIAADTTTDIPALIATAQADLDIITGATGVNLLAATQASIDAIETDTGTTLPATLAALNDVSTAEVLTQVNAAIDTAISELGVAAPTATPTIRTGLMLLYMMARNKLVVQTSGTDAIEVYNSAGTKITQKLITDVTGDYTEAEMG